ncbi:MAG: hypothetical protein LC540_15420 [Candidatus Thiodiazotropha sp.]|nr:hypothetical protein [Candidatus Thiodiazotropha sp.]
MKTIKPPKHEVVVPTDAELQEVAARLAVQRGLVLPETEQEVADYEQHFAASLAQAAARPPRTLQDVLACAVAFDTNPDATLTLKQPEEPETALALAARNGDGVHLSDETHRIMEEAMRDSDEDD